MTTSRTQAMFYYEDMKPEQEKSRFPFINYFRQRFNIGKFNPEESRKAIVQKIRTLPSEIFRTETVPR